MKAMGCAAQVIAGTEEFIDVREATRRCSLSDKSIRKIISDDVLPHYRNGKAGKILLRWSDFVACMERRRKELLEGETDSLLGILGDMKRRARR